MHEIFDFVFHSYNFLFFNCVSARTHANSHSYIFRLVYTFAFMAISSVYNCFLIVGWNSHAVEIYFQCCLQHKQHVRFMKTSEQLIC